jgi:hypothetical protein
MGVRRLFSRGGQKFSKEGEGQEPTFCLKSNKKDTFFKKSLKTYYFWPALAGKRGQEPLIGI